MPGAVKPAIWMGGSREDLKAFPADARREAGYQHDQVQRGDDPDDWQRCVSRRYRDEVNDWSIALLVGWHRCSSLLYCTTWCPENVRVAGCRCSSRCLPRSAQSGGHVS